jgi:hypothetical protein
MADDALCVAAAAEAECDALVALRLGETLGDPDADPDGDADAAAGELGAVELANTLGETWAATPCTGEDDWARATNTPVATARTMTSRPIAHRPLMRTPDPSTAVAEETVAGAARLPKIFR